MIIEASDFHLNPTGELSPQTYDLARLVKKERATLVLNGDVVNLLPLGLEPWRTLEGIKTVNELVCTLAFSACETDRFYWVCGNHDPYSWVKKLLKPYPYVKVVRKVVLEAECGLVEFRHGHQWAPDWVLLRHFAPGLVSMMTEGPFKKQWYNFCRSKHWIPSDLKEQARLEPDKKRDYLILIATIWRKALNRFQSTSRIQVVGHTHSRGGINIEGELMVADGGTMQEGEYTRIGKAIELCQL